MPTTLTVKIHRPHLAQAQIRREARRFNVVDCGRRFGKTLFGGDLLVESVLRGEPAAWFAPSYKYLIEVWDAVTDTLAPIITEVNKTDKRLKTMSGGVVRMWTLQDKDAGRGDAYARVVIDEAAMVPNLMSIWDNAIRPTLTDYQGDAWIFSTPKGHNAFWQMWQRGQGGEPDWRSWKFPTAANPYMLASEIEQARRTLPERVFAQEYLAEFMEDAGGVFRRVMAAATLEPQEQPTPGHQYVMGVDWGKANDWTVITVWDATTNDLVALDRFNQIDYAFQMERLRVLVDRWRPDCIRPEVNSMGEPLVEQLQRDGLPVVPFVTTNASKAAAVEALALAFERGDIHIINDATLIAELQAFEMSRTATGMTRYAAPEGMHDDMVMSAVMGYSAIAETGPLLL